MKKELSSIELKYLLEEFQQLKGSKVDKIYQPEKNSLLISFHVTGLGKKMLMIVLPGFIWLTETKPEMPEKIFGFCAALRKFLTNARLKEIKQIENERILSLEFETKEGKYGLITELFGKGNIILCKENKILTPMSMQTWKDRTIKKGEEYTHPSKEHNPFDISLAKFKKLIEASSDTISKTLAVQLGIGGTYAAEICIRAGIKKTAKKATEQEAQKMHETLISLLQQKIEPIVVLENNEVIDITPFKPEIYSEKNQEAFKTYSQALDSILSKDAGKKELKEVSDKFGKKIGKIDTMISIQREKLGEQAKTAEEYQSKGEKIYEKYQEFQKLLSEIKEMRKTMNWQEIKEKLKGIKYIKQINEKTGEIKIEI